MQWVDLLLAGFWGAGAAAGLSYCFNISRYDIIWGAVTGGIGWTVYTLAGAEGTAAYFWGALAVAGVSELLAVLIKNPATVYLVPGLLPLVPGGGMFMTMRAAVQGSLDEALSVGLSTLTAAGAIALSVALVSSTSRIITAVIRHLCKKR